MKTRLSSRHWTWLWWVGVPVLNALIVWAPYWVWNIVHQQVSWWRVDVLSSGVFDTYAYLQWLGQSAHGLDIGGSFRWFAWPLRWLTTPLLSIASVPEAWFVTRWVSTTLMVWVGAWSMAQWARLERGSARIFSVCFWISLVLVLGMRPGVYSWYLPVGFICINIVLTVKNALEESRLRTAIALSVLSLFLASVYSWFLIFFGLWLLTLWSIYLIRRSPILFRWLFLSVTMIVVGGGLYASPLLAQSPRWLLLMDFQERLGMSFTHLPFISNSLLVILGWLIVWFVYALVVREKTEERVTEMVGAWLVLLFSWLSSPFTGVYIHNDHFRTTVVILSWMSLAMLWVLLSRDSSDVGLVRPRYRRTALVMAAATFGFACLYLLRVAIRPYAFDGDTLNVVHMSHWFALALGAGLLLVSKKRAHLSRYFFPVMLIGSSLIGGIAFVAVYRDVYKVLPEQIVYRESIEWIREHVPVAESMCVDPAHADFFGAHTERRVYPAETTLYLSEATVDVVKRLAVIAGFYDARAAGQSTAFLYDSQWARGVTCDQFPGVVSLLKRFGYSPSFIDDLTGCQRAILDQLSDAMVLAMDHPVQDAAAFADICPWVIVPLDQQMYWHLPSSYREQIIDDGVSVWHNAP